MKKNSTTLFLFVFLVVLAVVSAIATHNYIIALLLALLAYVVHAILFTDHIYYDVKADYRYKFSNGRAVNGTFAADTLSLTSEIPSDADSCLAAIFVKSNLLGKVFDPYLELTAGDVTSRQYFERGVSGKRYINMSRLISALKQHKTVKISSHYCHVKNGDIELQAFVNPDYSKKRVLIISPHADDAELSAFGFYKNSAEVLIATITAGETEANAFEVLTGRGNKKSASILKGRLRAFDSIAVPQWAGRHVEAVHLGYSCMTLNAMHDAPEENISSHSAGAIGTAPFRIFNKRKLPSDINGENSWNNLLSDLTNIVTEFKPDIILTPHPIIDPQPDHLFSTRAIALACNMAQATPQFLLYANHYHDTDLYPFGPEHSDTPLPPHFGNNVVADALYSFPLSDADQVDKICALQMMHDLNRPTKFKKQLRRYLQRLIGRSKMPYGQDEYLRKAIRQQELFWVVSIDKLFQQLNAVLSK